MAGKRISTRDLAKMMNHGVNVLLVGEHGVGKTAMVKEAAEIASLEMKYFSASTMDPYLDFIGIPKAVEDAEGHTYLEMIKMRDLFKYEVMFFDEFNRAPKAVRNAVMELIQFKSINGVSFPNLKSIFAAINPWNEDEDYDVERLDPAQEDRFHYKLEIPYAPDRVYMTARYGDMGKAATDWWKGLGDNIKKGVSPRRLTYILDLYMEGMPIENVFPDNVPLSAFKNDVLTAPLRTRIERISKLDPSNPNFIIVADEIVQDPTNISCFIDIIRNFSNKQDKEKFFSGVMKRCSPEIFQSTFRENYNDIGWFYAKAALGNQELIDACLAVRDTANPDAASIINDILSKHWDLNSILSNKRGDFNEEWIVTSRPFVEIKGESDSKSRAAAKTLLEKTLAEYKKTKKATVCDSLIEGKFSKFISAATVVIDDNFTGAEALTILEIMSILTSIKREAVLIPNAMMSILNSSCYQVAKEKGIRPADLIMSGMFSDLSRTMLGGSSLTKFCDPSLEENAFAND